MSGKQQERATLLHGPDNSSLVIALQVGSYRSSQGAFAQAPAAASLGSNNSSAPSAHSARLRPPISGVWKATDLAPERDIPGFPRLPADLAAPADAAGPVNTFLVEPPSRAIVSGAWTALAPLQLSGLALRPSRANEPPRDIYFPSYRAQPSPCGRILVDVRPYGPWNEDAEERYRNLKQRPEPAYKLMHYDISQDRLHAVMTDLPAQHELYHVDWQPVPRASRIYAWACAQGPAYIVDAHQHCVLTRLWLCKDPMSLQVSPGAAPGQGPYQDASLWELDSSLPYRYWTSRHMEDYMAHTHDTKWSSDGQMLMVVRLKALGVASFRQALPLGSGL